MPRKLLKNPCVLRMLTWFYPAYMGFCFRTARVQWINRETMEKLDRKGQKLIIAFWHGRLAFIPYFSYRREGTHVMISRHGDGELIARAVAGFGFPLVRGSSNRAAGEDGKGYKDRGGAMAIRESLKHLKKGDAVAVTPDGPGGPRFIVQQGVIAMAKVSGATIIPLSFSTTGAKVIRSWDRFILPLPFQKIIMVAGEPVEVARGLDDDSIEIARKTLEDRLNSITRKADEDCGLILEKT